METLKIKLVVVEDNIPDDCEACEFSIYMGMSDKEGKIVDEYFCTFLDSPLTNEVDTSRSPKCPLVRALCPRCDGMGWVTVLDDSSIDGLGSAECPKCGGREVFYDKRATIEFEKETDNYEKRLFT